MNAALARPLMCKSNTSAAMAFISFLFDSPLLLIITRSNMQMRSSDLITDPFRTCVNLDPGKVESFVLFLFFANLDDDLQHR